MNKTDKIFVAGHNGMVGSAIVRKLQALGYTEIITKDRKELDLTNQIAVDSFFQKEQPEYIFIAAAKVGGILANATFRADFIYTNVMIQTNLINASYSYGAKKLLFLGSSCIYPKMSKQPMKEEYILSGPLEPTNQSYALAKLAGIEMCDAYRAQYGCNFISVMPTNLYGPNDNYDLKSSHVLPALLRKAHQSKKENREYLSVWGSGEPLREFMHVDDLADACHLLMQSYNKAGIINVGSGREVKIKELVSIIMKVVGYKGQVIYDSDKPDGTPRKLMDSSKIDALGWNPKIGLEEGIKSVYSNITNENWY